MGAMPTALGGHACLKPHGHAKPWPWHPPNSESSPRREGRLCSRFIRSAAGQQYRDQDVTEKVLLGLFHEPNPDALIEVLNDLGFPIRLSESGFDDRFRDGPQKAGICCRVC